MQKIRQVRFQFPAAFVELVRALGADCGKREIANALSLPLSTVYRWSAVPPTPSTELAPGWTRRADPATARSVAALIAACEADGLAVRTPVARLAPGLTQTAFGDAEAFRARVRCALAHFASRDARTDQAAQPHDRLLRAKREIDVHYYTRLSCRSLAHIAGMSKFNFIRAFRAAFGVSPYRYLILVRVDHAKHMLALTDQPLPVVAASVGFASASSLARAFKRFVGASPSRFLCRRALTGPATTTSSLH